MEMERLIVNIGSSSKKYALYRDGTQIFSCHFEHENNGFVVAITHDGKVEHEHLDQESFEKAVVYFLNTYKKYFGDRSIDSIGIRIVAPGGHFQHHRIINDEYLDKLKSVKNIVPIHIEGTLKELLNLKEIFPQAKMVGVSDSAFHFDMPEVAQSYGIPLWIRNEYNIKRFGYHGLSIDSVVERLRNHLDGKLPEKIIVLHLGSGCSVTALRNGKTVDTSMGFTPLEGLVMSTRSGSFDPAVVLSLIEKGKNKEEIENILNKQSGLLGLSGKTDDMREIISLSNNGDKSAQHALEVFIYKILYYVGAYRLILGGLDAIIFTGTIGERSFIVREKIVRELASLFVGVDKEVNNGEDGSVDRVQIISDPGSQICLYVVPANESKSILQAMDNC